MVAAIALALVLMLSLVSSAIATPVAILAPHKDGVSAAVRSQIKERNSVTACSKKHFGKCVKGATKSSSLGKKVQLPGGTWVDCAGDCNNTLRVKTVDFWYDQMLRQ
jgi:hypothetical protein